MAHAIPTLVAPVHRTRVLRALLVAVAIGFVAREVASDRDTFVTILLNGLTAAGLYFLVASGFTLIFGLLRVTNLAHGSYYLVGGYVGYSLREQTGSWLVALVGASIFVALLGMAFQLLILRRVAADPIREALVTIGLTVVAADLTLRVWGGAPRDIGVPRLLEGTLTMGDLTYSKYRLALLALAAVVGIALWVLLLRTRLGMTIRAGVDDPAMLAATGVNVPVVFTLVFGLGAMLAGFAGVAGGSYLSISQGEDARYLLVSLLVVIVGGLGSVSGAAVGALAVGLVEAFAQVHLPTYSVLVTFGVMVVILAVRPRGLFGGAA
ncbi:branched-chain amino acid ABC transporter permease [Nocardioides sp. LS1]|uniref:branched-chain amino acid ABC transporter permease n=1 Tax=Nocardioides sp. LS1 TaxID=1027620 RepID=UPI000F6275DB|nr:branched-chain amino acid ABC transporter permease [Nocardioides sp. LS1]GCD88187.1 branched-chain amino acid ABC transporter permease [Nocardioides sp. LS1]